MRSRRVILLIAATALLAAACSAVSDREVQLQDPARSGSGLAVELAQQEVEGGFDALALAEQTTNQVAMLELATAAVLDGVRAECAANTEALDRMSADLSDRTFIAPQDLRCSQLADASLENAKIMGVDFTGASLSGANLRNARLQIVAIGADFSGADLTGADLSGSDLTGATFTSATLVGSNLTGLVTSAPELQGMTAGGLTRADFTDATVGCNQLEGSPMMSLPGVVFDTTCGTANVDGRTDMTLTGSFLGSDLNALRFDRVHLVATDFRATSMVGASFADFGVLPRGLLFVNADLTGADFSGNTLDTAAFVRTNLTGATFSASIVNDSWFVGADLTNADFSIVESEHNDFRSSIVSATDFTNASLSWDDFSGAVFSSPLTEGLVVEAIVCDGSADADNGNSVRNFGLCTAGDTLIF